ncbi:6,7-dimethyl-8-ribityllumazine synthase [Aliidiomarina haloalkalitolerans]|uniref:6,7-dimethyl-8-ribityllumazine synthase n=1 Tax=Aliidiomarina haloalkalitolerans TaxID=859059 RepID=A0A432VTR0_9GAMM|nr:6,7-dimethyl-8-ribityllumazine synthase [Aliidiomarina haloalkalitolerans]RUO19857.1 6,7-dimethyl-8-ribityllumazine synthase [Aliidiomarina haloalkalitolerans]
MKIIEAGVAAPGKKVAIVVSRFNSFIVEKLMEGAVDTLTRIGQIDSNDITIIKVPGAYELPITAKKAAASGKFAAVIAIGAVIRGGTPHFDFVAGQANSGLAQVAMETGVPVAFGVITTDTDEQAIDRAGVKHGNKGSEAALSALEMINVLDQL